jgi:hypothetical protein
MSAKKYQTGDVVPAGLEAQLVIARSWSEDQLQKSVEDCARKLGWLYYHTRDSRKSTAGFPDLVMVRGARIIFAELKSQKGDADPAQVVWFEALHGVDHLEVVVWRPLDWLTGAIEWCLRA